MPLIIPGKPQIDFFLRTTKPFHNDKAVNDFSGLFYPMGWITVRSGMEEVSR